MEKSDTESKVSVIIPCYNEEANLKNGVLDQVAKFLDTQDFSWEVLIVDDESTDNSLTLCQQFSEQHSGFRVIQVPHGGKPFAIYSGLKEAGGKFVLFTDMDQSTPIYEINKLIGCFDSGYDIVIGSRGVQRSGSAFIRQITSWGFRELRRLIVLPEITDTQCGFKMLRTDVAKEIFPHLSFLKSEKEKAGWAVSAYDVELLFIASTWGHKIKEVEVEWVQRDESVTKGNNRNRYLRESVDMGKEILNVLRNKLRGEYKKRD